MIPNTTGFTALRFCSAPLGELPPPAPRDCFGRDELIEKIVGLAEKLEPIALIGAGGIGKTCIALKALHHKRIKERFGANRRFIRCDQFPASRAHFLSRLSKVIGAEVENPEDLTPLRHLLSSMDTLIVLDNAESILDPKEPGAREIYSVVDELCQFETICLCITSRITIVPTRCERPGIPTLSVQAARDLFYGIHRNIPRSSTINDLLERLDFHALSIKLLATTASHNGWDHDRLAEEWDAQRVQALQTDYNESLAQTIELSLASPTFLSLGPDARNLLGVVAFFPQGVYEKNLDWLFPTIPNRKNMFDKFCVLSLAYRRNGFITMLAPIRDYLGPQDPSSSPLLCATGGHYFTRLSVYVQPGDPGFGETRWIVLEDVNIEYLLDVFISIDQTKADNWDACFHFVNHLVWHKPRRTILGSKIEALTDDHPSKARCLVQLSGLFQQIGNHTERKRLLSLTLELQKQRGDEAEVAQTLRLLAGANRLLSLFTEGIQQAKGALEIFERISHRIGQAQALDDLAWLFFGNGQLDAAEDAASRAIDLFSTEPGYGYTVCALRRVLGQIHQSKGEKEKAIHNFKTVLGVASLFNWHDELCRSHQALAALFRDESEFDEANLHIAQAKSHALNYPFFLGSVTYMHASVLAKQDRFEDAKSEVLRALRIFEELGAVKDAANCRDSLQVLERVIKSRSARS